MQVASETGRDGPPTVAEGVDLLDAFTAAAHARHDAEVSVVETLGRLVRAGVIETLEGPARRGAPGRDAFVHVG